ncbi:MULTISPECIES: TIGR04222 domain-containing membrane protein [Polymorphospora]|uniref:TIGR04222 domain-containing membrane protein n=1 Tax=Polymorphospora lycopeni TaxID=3140240 RepID=A0ABV5D119_9ACTN
MEVPATPADTWGIPSTTFLLIFFFTATTLVTLAVVHRLILFAGRRDVPPAQLGPQQAAYLNGGDRLAVYSSLAALRSAGVIGVAKDRTLAVGGQLPLGATPLDTAVYNAAQKRIKSRQLLADSFVARALDQLRESLEQQGLAPSAGTRRAARIVPAVMLALVLVGVVRIFAGLANDRPVGFLILLTVLYAPVAIVFLSVVPRRTRAARAALSQLRVQHVHLSPRTAPAYATYGAAGAAMGVALFGAASLWALDPAFAADAEIQRNYASAGGGSGSSCSGGSSSDGGGGGSCGGGGGCGGCGGCGG